MYASTLAHGILAKFTGDATTYLNNAGTYTLPALTVSYSPGSFTVVTATYRLVGPHLKMTTDQRMTVQGTGRVRGSN